MKRCARKTRMEQGEIKVSVNRQETDISVNLVYTLESCPLTLAMGNGAVFIPLSRKKVEALKRTHEKREC